MGDGKERQEQLTTATTEKDRRLSRVLFSWVKPYHRRPQQQPGCVAYLQYVIRRIERPVQGGLRKGVQGGLRKRKNKRYSVTRKWKRTDSPSLARDFVSNLLTVLDPDLGTRNEHRYASARCGCGCNMVVEVRIDNLRAGTASCPTRRKAQQRSFMEKKEHIKHMKLIGNYLKGLLNNQQGAREAAVKYAHNLTTDTGLQEMVRQAFPKDLAERDFARARQVSGIEDPLPAEPVVVPPVQSTPPPVAVAVPAPYKGKGLELVTMGFLIPFGTSTYAFTAKGEAWKDAGRPDPATWTWTPQATPTAPLNIPSVTPTVNMLVATPQEWEIANPALAKQAVSWYYARHNDQMPPEDFDLRAYYLAEAPRFARERA